MAINQFLFICVLIYNTDDGVFEVKFDIIFL